MPDPDAAAPVPRIAPTVAAGVGIWLADAALTAAVQASAGVLDVVRRQFGRLWPAMVAHGVWDIATFLAGGFAQPWLTPVSLALQLVVAGLGLAILVGLARRDRTVVLP